MSDVIGIRITMYRTNIESACQLLETAARQLVEDTDEHVALVTMIEDLRWLKGQDVETK